MNVWRTWVGPTVLGCVVQWGLHAWLPSLYLTVRCVVQLLAFAGGQWLLATDRDATASSWGETLTLMGGRLLKIMLMGVLAEFMLRSPPPPPMDPLVPWTVHGWDLGAAFCSVTLVLGGALWWTAQGEPAYGPLLWMWARATFAWGAVHWLWLALGDSVIQAFRDQPAHAALATSVIVGLLALFRWLWPAASPVMASGQALAGGAVMQRPPLPPTPRDRQVVAVHEAGHALIYGALATPPPSLKAAIRGKAPHESVHGWVQGKAMPHQLLSLPDLHWLCLLDLAGMAAEEVVTGQVHQGNLSDQQQWLTHVTEWLRHHPTEVFYTTTVTEEEQAINQRKLESLRALHWAWLVAFMTQHRAVLEALRDALLVTPTLNAPALQPFLAKVTWPSDGPQPSFKPEG